MPQQGFHCFVDFEDVSFDACITCAATRGRCHLTASVLRGMADQARARAASEALPAVGQGRAPADDDSSTRTSEPAPLPKLSVTALVGCTRQAYLKATEPYYQRPDQQYWSYRGTLGHLLVAGGAGPEVVSEQRFERELRLPTGRVVTITGQPDEIDPARRLLIDYKTVERPPRTPSPTHIAQLNLYRWLVAPSYPIDRLGIVYLTMRATRKVEVPIWPDGQVERYLYERAGGLAEAFAGGAWPELTEDRWLCDYCPVLAACQRGPAPPEPDGALEVDGAAEAALTLPDPDVTRPDPDAAQLNLAPGPEPSIPAPACAPQERAVDPSIRLAEARRADGAGAPAVPGSPGDELPAVSADAPEPEAARIG